MSDRLFVGTRKGLFRINRGPAGWRVAEASFLGDHCSIVLPDSRDGSVYAALHHEHFGDKIHRSTDGGTSWEERPAPAYPEQPDGDEDLDPMSGTPVAWKLRLVWSLESAGADAPGGLWCGTIPGGLFRSDDGGSTWEMVRSLWDHPGRREWFGGGADHPGIHSICVDPRDSKRVLVGVSCGGVWVTDDGGLTWTCRAEGMRAEYMPPERSHEPGIQDPHRIVQCRAAPDTLWCQHHNGMFLSRDGSATWSEIDAPRPSAFGFATAVHPQDPDLAWFVPAVKDEVRIPVDGRLVVLRTRDGGASFEQLSEGLPEEHAYDLVFRHALDVDGSGDRLAFGSTTGSLWVSEDQGDSWASISHHLPPVYCVRFAE